MGAGDVGILILSGLTSAAILFLVSTGIQLVFGALRIVNVAHGSFYMYGAFVMASMMEFLPFGRELNYWASLVLVTLTVALIGVVIEFVILRRIYDREHLAQLLVTFSLFFILADLARQVWGTSYRTVPTPALLEGSVHIFDRLFPVYNLFTIAVALGAGLFMLALLKFTMFGWRIRSAVEDPELLACTGTNVGRLFTLVFAIGVGMAGLAGAVVAPLQAVNFGIDANILVAAFIVSIVGGLGSITGAALGSVIIGLFQAVGIVWFPQWASTCIFIAMILLLAFRPEGLLGKPE